MGELFKGIGNLQNSIGKMQYNGGMGTTLAKRYKTREDEKMLAPLKEYMTQMGANFKKDRNGGIDVNKNFDLSANMVPARMDYSDISNPTRVKTVDEMLGLKSNTPTNTAPAMSYREPLTDQQTFQKHAPYLSLAGFKPDALRMGMLNQDENYDAARIANKLDMSAKENADYGLDVQKYKGKTLLDILTQGRNNFETDVQYGGDNDLTTNLMQAVKELGLDGVLNFKGNKDKKGTKVMTAESQVTADNARANASNSTAYRNYNKPFFKPDSGGGGGNSVKYSVYRGALGDIDKHNAYVAKHQDDDGFNETQSPYYRRAQAGEKIVAQYEGDDTDSAFTADLSVPNGVQPTNNGLQNNFGKEPISQAEYQQLKQQGYSDADILKDTYING